MDLFKYYNVLSITNKITMISFYVINVRIIITLLSINVSKENIFLKISKNTIHLKIRPLNVKKDTF